MFANTDAGRTAGIKSAPSAGISVTDEEKTRPGHHWFGISGDDVGHINEQKLFHVGPDYHSDALCNISVCNQQLILLALLGYGMSTRQSDVHGAAME